MTYYFIYGFLLLAQALGSKAPQLRAILYWFLLVVLFLFSGFRYQVGCDWSGYLVNWLSAEGYSFSELIGKGREPAHWGLISLLQGGGLSYTYLNVVTSFLFFFGFHHLARRQPNPLAFLVLAFPILIINMPMSGIRQGTAIGFVCIAYVAFIDRNLIKYILSVFAGTLFHSSAIVFVVLAPFIFGKFSKRNIILAGILALPGVVAISGSDAANLAASRYIGTGIDAAGSAFRVALLTLTGAGYVFFVAPRWRGSFSRDYKLVTIGAWMMLSLAVMVPISTVIGDRLGYYLIPLQLIIFVRLPYLFKGGLGSLIALLPYVGLPLVFLVWTYLSHHFQICYLPYKIGF